MEKQCSPYLCGCVFFLLLTEAKGKHASCRQLYSGCRKFFKQNGWSANKEEIDELLRIRTADKANNNLPSGENI